MKLIINGEEKEFERVDSLSELLAHLQVDTRSVAVAQNRVVVPKNSYTHTRVHSGDEIEILIPMQGG